MTATDEIVGIIGMDVLGAHQRKDFRFPPEGLDGPGAFFLPTGWTIVGRLPWQQNMKKHLNHVSRQLQQDLHEMVYRLWSTEAMGLQPELPKPMSEEDKRGLNTLRSTIRHDGEM